MQELISAGGGVYYDVNFRDRFAKLTTCAIPTIHFRGEGLNPQPPIYATDIKFTIYTLHKL